MVHSSLLVSLFFFFNDTATTEIYTLSLHDALPISVAQDLATFDALFHIPAPPSFTILCPDGCPVFAPHDTHHDEAGWSVETSLTGNTATPLPPGGITVLAAAPPSSGTPTNLPRPPPFRPYPGRT